MECSKLRPRGSIGPVLMILVLLVTVFTHAPALAGEQAANPYVLVAENLEDPLFERAWVDADDFLLNNERAGLHVMFQFSQARAEALHKEIASDAPPLLFMAFFEVNRKDRTIRRGDYQILDAQGIPLSHAEGWTEWESAETHNQGTLLLQVADQLEEALRAQGRWSD